jgi:hypothetical protein
MTVEVATITPLPPPKHLVTRIGMGAKLHLSSDYGRGGRLYPACGSDSPFSKARPTGYGFEHITCVKCLARAKALGLIPSPPAR